MLVFRKKMKVSNVISVENILQTWIQFSSDYMVIKMFICDRWILLVDHSPVLKTKIRRRKSQSRRWRNFGVGSNWTLLGKFAVIDLFDRKSRIILIICWKGNVMKFLKIIFNSKLQKKMIRLLLMHLFMLLIGRFLHLEPD